MVITSSEGDRQFFASSAVYALCDSRSHHERFDDHNHLAFPLAVIGASYRCVLS